MLISTNLCLNGSNLCLNGASGGPGAAAPGRGPRGRARSAWKFFISEDSYYSEIIVSIQISEKITIFFFRPGSRSWKGCPGREGCDLNPRAETRSRKGSKWSRSWVFRPHYTTWFEVVYTPSISLVVGTLTSIHEVDPGRVEMLYEAGRVTCDLILRTRASSCKVFITTSSYNLWPHLTRWFEVVHGFKNSLVGCTSISFFDVKRVRVRAPYRAGREPIDLDLRTGLRSCMVTRMAWS